MMTKRWMNWCDRDELKLVKDQWNLLPKRDDRLRSFIYEGLVSKNCILSEKLIEINVKVYLFLSV